MTDTTQVGALTMSAEPGELFKALAAAALAMGKVLKDARGNYGTYATLASSLDACHEALAGAGVCISQGTKMVDGIAQVTTLLGHTSGQWMACTLSGLPTKDNIHGLGSVITYLRRYSLMAMVGLAPEDDDGQQAVNDARPRQSRPEPPDQLAQACGSAVDRGWPESEVDGCLRYFGSTDGRAASVPAHARAECLRALQGAPPQRAEPEPPRRDPRSDYPPSAEAPPLDDDDVPF